MSSNLNKLVQPECGAPNPLVRASQQIASRAGAPRVRQAPSAVVRASQLNFVEEFASSSRMIANHSQQQQQQQSQRQQQQQQQQQNKQQQSHPISFARGIPSEPFQHYQPFLRHQQQAPAASSVAQVSAGDQLDIKYRNDMISQATSKGDGVGRVDDVEFWQSISQAYIGPTTFDNISKARVRQGASETNGERATTTPAQLATDATDDKQLKDNVEREDEPVMSEEEKMRLWEEGLEAARLMDGMKLDELEYVFDERNPLKDQFEDPFSEGLQRLEQGDIPSAALLFEAAVQKEPENAIAWRYLGTTQAQNEKDKSAIRALNNCLQLDPTDQMARLAISVSLVNETQHQDACKHLLEWLIRHDKYRSIQASVEEFQRLDEGRLSEDPFYMSSMANSQHYSYVRDKFVEAARLSPNNPDPEVQNSLGVLFNMRGEYDKAVDCFKAALSVQSSDSLLWNRLGATLANSNKSDEAVIAYRRALEIAPGFLRSRYNLAISLIHLNLFDEAAKQLVQILNTQAAGKGSSKGPQLIRTRSITSTSIWNTLRTVATLMNKPQLYPIIDGRDLAKCNEILFERHNHSRDHRCSLCEPEAQEPPTSSTT